MALEFSRGTLASQTLSDSREKLNFSFCKIQLVFGSSFLDGNIQSVKDENYVCK